jgi:hypothetical protein
VVAAAGRALTAGQSRWAAFCRSSHAAISSGDRPACCMAVTWLVLVLLTADGPILVQAALRTRHGGAIEAFDFSGAMAQRAGIGWYGHVCSFSSVDAGKPRAAAPSSPGEIPPARAWTPRVQPFRKLDRRSRFGIISNLFKHGNVVERRREGPSPSASPSRRRLGSHPLPGEGC